MGSAYLLREGVCAHLSSPRGERNYALVVGIRGLSMEENCPPCLAIN